MVYFKRKIYGMLINSDSKRNINNNEITVLAYYHCTVLKEMFTLSQSKLT
jgi:hypothetical protein